MCNIAGYIGNKRAAPILVEMLKKQEGFCGGFYTGIITYHEGTLYTAKVIGDVDRLLAETDALNFPGTCGLIHSRSKSGGDVHHAHPFVSNDGNLAMVLNGGIVRYAPVYNGADTAKELDALGVRFDTETEYTDAMKGHCLLPNGHCVHNSQVVCHYTDYYKKSEGLSTSAALEKIFLRMPQESVALAMHAEDGPTVSFANYNMPMSVARTEDEVFLSSMSIVFPEDRDYFVSGYIPPASSGSITLEETKIHRFKPALPIGNLTPEIVHAGYEIIVKMLEEEAPCGIGKLNNGVRGLWGELIDQRYPLTYSVLQDLQNAGKLEIVKTQREGVTPEYTAPLYYAVLKK
jgi:hypothetical protein